MSVRHSVNYSLVFKDIKLKFSAYVDSSSLRKVFLTILQKNPSQKYFHVLYILYFLYIVPWRYWVYAQYHSIIFYFYLQKIAKSWIYLTVTPYVCTYWTISWQPTVYVQQNIFEKTNIEVGSSHLYSSFVTFCVQIGQLFEAKWVFKKCIKTVKSQFSKENDVDFEFFRKFKVSLYQFWHKRCQKKRKDVS